MTSFSRKGAKPPSLKIVDDSSDAVFQQSNPLETLPQLPIDIGAILASLLLPFKTLTRAPAAKLARLAVSIDRQRRGLGSIMMVEAIKRTLAVAENIGIIGFFVDAKNQSACEYYEQFGFIALPDNPLDLFLPLHSLKVAMEAVDK